MVFDIESYYLRLTTYSYQEKNDWGSIQVSLMGEYIEKRWSAKDLENELFGLIKKYNAIRKTNLIIYAGAIGKPVPDIALCMDDYYILSDMLREVTSNKLDFYIETPGGSGETAEEIVRCLRSRFDDVTFVVSGQAKSAGTLLVLSGNEIIMTESGSLGPIDAQVQIGRSRVSAYDYVEWVKEKQIEAQKNKKLNPFDATMVAQISPGELSGVEHSLKYAEDLAVDWLTNYKFKNWDFTETRKIPVTEKKKRNTAKKIALALTNHGKWRTHGRSIKIGDLEEIGLKIIRADDVPGLADIIYRIQTIIRLLFSTTSIYKIFATEKEKIVKQAVPIEKVQRLPGQISDHEPRIVNIEIKCPKCGEKHKVYAKLKDDKRIDEEQMKKGGKPFPAENKIICECGFEIDLAGIRNEIETKTGKKIVL